MIRTRLRPQLAGMAMIIAMVASTMTVLSTPASAAVPGLQIVSTVSSSNSVSPKSAVANCPSGKRVIATGAQITGGGGDVVLEGLVPSQTSVTATADENDLAITSNWTVSAFAICADPLPGLQIVSTVSNSGSVHRMSVGRSCPSGKLMTGTGAQITGGGGNVVLDELVPTSQTSVTATGEEDHTATTSNWTVSAFAICANR
jgi:hypothetical protein